jgi:hypothetical protein
MRDRVVILLSVSNDFLNCRHGADSAIKQGSYRHREYA